MKALEKKDIINIDFETIGDGMNDQIYAIETVEGDIIYATALIDKEFDVVIECKQELSQEIKDEIYIEALNIWREELNAKRH